MLRLGRVLAAASMLAALTAPAALWPLPQTPKPHGGGPQVRGLELNTVSVLSAVAAGGATHQSDTEEASPL